jgi:hypothetical protein
MSIKLKSFDETLDEFENGGKKKQERDLLKVNKKKQISNKVTSLEAQLDTKKLEFNKSLTEPNMDTIQIGLDIKVLEKELEYAQEVQSALFPKADAAATN